MKIIIKYKKLNIKEETKCVVRNLCSFYNIRQYPVIRSYTGIRLEA